MIGISSLMFLIATLHLTINAYRMVAGYVDHALLQGGAVAYMGDLRSWHYILKDTLYATQENLGSAAAIYRCWVLWGHNWKIILFPSVLLIVNIGANLFLLFYLPIPVAGYMVCGLYGTVSPTNNIFDPRLTTWIKIFFPLTVALNVITTSLMSYRIWCTHRQTSLYTSGNSQLISVMRILVESAALQLVVEIILLALYSSDVNAQYIGITFNALTIRIKLHSISTAGSGHSMSFDGATQTIGRLPMRRIQVNISRDVEETEDNISTLSSK
ncbi:hypothetical protein F5877DRAFT_38188 [Lentinula edodes]|nr:hypothetical protein F5877DRAFT_38188 [Lentinula edodes]